MDSSNEHRILIYSTYDSYDSDYSSDSNHSMEQPPSVDNREESLMRNPTFFNSAVDCSISDLHKEAHHKATVQSLSGSVVAAAGEIIVIVGLILAPFTVGASLVVTGLGVTASAAGTLTRIASNIREMKEKTSYQQIGSILKELNFTQIPRGIELRLYKIPRAKQTDPTTREEQMACGIGRGIGYAAEAVCLGIYFKLGADEAQVSKGVIAFGEITGALACLFLLMDIRFIVYHFKQLREINKERRNGNGKSSICKFIKGMKETVDHLNQTLDQLQEVRQQFDAMIKKEITETNIISL